MSTDWVDKIKTPASAVQGQTDWKALQAPRHWKGEAGDLYLASVRGQSSAAGRIGTIADQVSLSCTICASTGLVFYVALAGILAKFIMATVAAVGALMTGVGAVAAAWDLPGRSSGERHGHRYGGPGGARSPGNPDRGTEPRQGTGAGRQRLPRPSCWQMAQGHGVSMREPKRIHPLAALLMLLGIGGLCTAVAFAVKGHPVPANALFPISLVLFGAAQVYNHRRRQRDWFYRTFRTYENFRAEVIEEVRQVRYEKGDAAIVRHLRMLYPHLPVPVITRLIKEL